MGPQRGGSNFEDVIRGWSLMLQRLIWPHFDSNSVRLIGKLHPSVSRVTSRVNGPARLTALSPGDWGSASSQGPILTATKDESVAKVARGGAWREIEDGQNLISES